MKKRILTMLAVLVVSAGVMAGCAKEEAQQGTDQGVQSSEVVQENNGAVESVETEKAEENVDTERAEESVSEVTGTLDEIKDFMFVVTDDAGTSYAFPFEEKPEELEQLAVGDKVTVKYTGTISEVDPFMGEILSIEKQS